MLLKIMIYLAGIHIIHGFSDSEASVQNFVKKQIVGVVIALDLPTGYSVTWRIQFHFLISSVLTLSPHSKSTFLVLTLSPHP